MDATLTPKQKKRLHEVADLMLQIFHTLARMRYLEPEWIEPGPHDISALMPLYISLNIDPAIIYLYSILPYLNEAAHHHGVDFFRGGEFVDFRERRDVERGRNPMHTSEPESMMRPWITPLSAIGNHCTALLYDAKRHVVGIYAQMDAGSSDPNLYEGVVFSTQNEAGEQIYVKNREDGTEERCDVSEWEKYVNRTGDDSEDEDDDEEGDGDEEGDDDQDENDDGDEGEDEDEEEEDINHWDEMDARPAGNVLRDIIRWYHELFEIPGDGERTSGEWDRDLVEPIYRKHGWPGEDFDGDAFLADKARAEPAWLAEQDAKQPEPSQQLEILRVQLEQDRKSEDWAMPHRQTKLAAATTLDEEWLVRWEIWGAEQRTRNLQDKFQREEELLGPDGGRVWAEDLPLLELKRVHINLLQAKSRMEQLKMTALDPQIIQDGIRSVEEETALYEKAYAAELADADRLRPGKPPFSLGPGHETGGSVLKVWPELTTKIVDTERHIAEIRGWIAQLPNGAIKARESAEELAEIWKTSIGSWLRSRQHSLDELAKRSRESSD